MNTPLLHAKTLAVAYGGIQAVKGIELHVNQGELVSLIGANGAGKTTTLKALAGLLAPTGGEILYQGQSLLGTPTHDIVRKGIALVPEGRGIFKRLTVEENLDMGAYSRADKAGIARDKAMAFDLFPRLAERRQQKAGTLSGGEQQMLAISRALMSKPRLLLLDEPSMGLAPIMVQKIFEVVRNISREGVTLLLVEQNAKVALEISHRGYVMESGRITLAADAQSLLADEKVRHAYLGE